MNNRKCGICSVCCTVGYVPELKKPAYTRCTHVDTNACGSCKIFDKNFLPDTCKNYNCAWIQGWGEDYDKPNKNNVMITDNILENQRYFTCIELEENAIFSHPAKKMIEEIVSEMKIPMIVSKYGMKPPYDTGDYVIIHESIKDRCKRICGDLIWNEGDISVYVLLKGH
jgi:hypothetical protein